MDARIVAQLHVDLAEAGVDGSHLRGAMLQQTIGKASGRSAHIEARAARYVNLPMAQSRGQLESTAAYVGIVPAKQPDRCVGRNRSAGLVNFLFAHQDPSGKNQRTGALAADGKAALDEHDVKPRFLRPCVAGGCFWRTFHRSKNSPNGQLRKSSKGHSHCKE